MPDGRNPWDYPREKTISVRNALIFGNARRAERLAGTTHSDLIQLLSIRHYPEDSNAYKLVEQILDILSSEYPDKSLDRQILWSHWTKTRNVVKLLIKLFDEIEKGYWEYRENFFRNMIE